MKNFIVLICLLSLTSCSTYLRTSGTRMISPEANGKLLKGSFDLGHFKGYKQYQMDFRGSSTKTPLDDIGETYGASIYADLGVWDRIDVFVIPSLVMTSTLLGGKFQLWGDPRSVAKKGNLSISLVTAFGGRNDERVDEEDEGDLLDGGVDKIESGMDHREIGLIVGYRYTENLLHYINAYFYEEEVSGKVTNNSGSLTDASFNYKNHGEIFSTGLILYLKTGFHLKLDYSHLTTDWTYNHSSYSNFINGAIGFSW